VSSSSDGHHHVNRPSVLEIESASSPPCGFWRIDDLYNYFMHIMLIVLYIYVWMGFKLISMYVYEMLFMVVPC
jgi:hypothetical protein